MQHAHWSMLHHSFWFYLAKDLPYLDISRPCNAEQFPLSIIITFVKHKKMSARPGFLSLHYIRQWSTRISSNPFWSNIKLNLRKTVPGGRLSDQYVR